MVKNISSWSNKTELLLDEEMSHLNLALEELRGEKEISDKPVILPRVINKITDEKVLEPEVKKLETKKIIKKVQEFPKLPVITKPRRDYKLKNGLHKIEWLLTHFKSHKRLGENLPIPPKPAITKKYSLQNELHQAITELQEHLERID